MLALFLWLGIDMRVKLEALYIDKRHIRASNCFMRVRLTPCNDFVALLATGLEGNPTVIFRKLRHGNNACKPEIQICSYRQEEIFSLGRYLA
jgi:hypothetical protein